VRQCLAGNRWIVAQRSILSLHELPQILGYEPAGMPQYRGIPLGVIDEGEVPNPAMHVWTKSKVPWTSFGDDIPVYETHP
jgi:hypothetical protein